MVAGVVLEVLVQDLIARPHHDGRTELHGPASRLALPVPRGEGPEARRELAGTDQCCDADGSRAHNLGSGAFLVEEDGEWNVLFLDEGLRIPAASGAYGGHLRPGGEYLFVSVADLTGPLTARQSTEMTKEQNHLGLIAPEIAQPLLGTVGIDQDLVRQRS